jgi:hypothetical protein
MGTASTASRGLPLILFKKSTLITDNTRSQQSAVFLLASVGCFVFCYFLSVTISLVPFDD